MEGAGAPLFHPQESHILDLQVVLRLTDWQMALVYLWFHTVHATTLFRH